MTERAYHINHHWIGIVVSIFDPDMEGKVQARVFGLHDDTTNVPDNMLIWMKPAQDITSAAQNKMGTSPHGVVKGSIIGGYWLDSDRQHGVFTHTIAKAGDPQTGSGTTTNGQQTLMQGTNSTPPGARVANNAFQTRNNKKVPITQLDNAQSQYPTVGTPAGTSGENKDSDGVDVTGNAIGNTQSATNPTVGTSNPIGQILNQIEQLDPQKINSVLPQAVNNFIKILDLHTFSSTAGSTGLLGTMLGQAMSAIGASNVLNALGNSPQVGQLSTQAQSALQSAIGSAASGGGGGVSTMSPTIQAVAGQSQVALTQALTGLVNTKTLNATTLNALVAAFLAEIQNNGSQMALGSSQGNILSNLTSLLPTIAGAIESVLQGHLPSSVLNQGLISNAVQAFSYQQAFIKAPSTGKKFLAQQAVQGAISTSAKKLLGSIPGVSSGALSNLTSIL